MRIRDNSGYKAEEFASILNLTGTILNRTLADFEHDNLFVFPRRVKDSADLDTNDMILRSQGSVYRSTNVMGFIGLSDEHLGIDSRFCEQSGDFFLQYLLNRVMHMPAMLDLSIGSNPHDEILNLCMFMFPACLTAAMRRGIYRTYVRREYNDSNVRGTIEVARHIALNTPFVGNVAYSQGERSYDNEITELIRHTIEYMRTKPIGRQLLRGVRNEMQAIREVTPTYEWHQRRKVILENKRNVIRHPYYREYRALQRLCLMILQDRQTSIHATTQQLYGILFDGSWLWEQYVNTLIGDAFHHPNNRTGEGVQYLFAGKAGPVYPDFIGRDSSHSIIADAKYKPIENIKKNDYWQILAYMFRFDSSTGVFIYPSIMKTEATGMLLNRGTSYDRDVRPRNGTHVYKVGVQIPQRCGSYVEFVENMSQAEKAFLTELNPILNGTFAK